MKAAVYYNYGPPEVFQIAEISQPLPGKHEVLIEIKATTVTAADTLMRKGEPRWGRIILGIRKPRKKVLGIEFAGVIASTGEGVSRFKTGDKVFGFTGFRLGAQAEYACLSENASLELMPATMNFEEAAAIVDGATTSVFFLMDKAGLKPGQKVLIIGASGSIGTAAVQLSKQLGAHVTGVCSGKNADLVKSLGANRVIDYTQETFTQVNEKWDLIFDTVGKSSFFKCRRVLSPKGIYLPTTGLYNNLLQGVTFLGGNKRVVTGMSVKKNRALLFIRELIEKGKLKPVIDRSYPLDEITEAHRYVDTGHKRGNVVILP